MMFMSECDPALSLWRPLAALVPLTWPGSLGDREININISETPTLYLDHSPLLLLLPRTKEVHLAVEGALLVRLSGRDWSVSVNKDNPDVWAHYNNCQLSPGNPLVNQSRPGNDSSPLPPVSIEFLLSRFNLFSSVCHLGWWYYN